LAISKKTRKILWAKSGNICAICKKPLVIDKTEQDKEAVVGDECHIIAQSKGGPRYDKDFQKDQIDDLYNLILLCKSDHKMIDDQCSTYTVELLRLLKKQHEEWVRNKLAKDKSHQSDNDPTFLVHMNSGKDLFNTIDGAEMFGFDFDETNDKTKMEVISSCLQEIQDFGDISGDFIEVSEKISAMESMKRIINEIESVGYLVFGIREKKWYKNSEGKKFQFNVATVRLVNAENPTIIRFKYEKENA